MSKPSSATMCNEEARLCKHVNETVHCVVCCYISYLSHITIRINNMKALAGLTKTNSDQTVQIKLNTAKFLEVANELLDFTELHEHLAKVNLKLYEVDENSNKAQALSVVFNYNNRESTIFELFQFFAYLYLSSEKVKLGRITLEVVVSEINYKSIEQYMQKALNKLEIKVNEVMNYMTHNLLVENPSKHQLKSYNELINYTVKRKGCYKKQIVSAERVDDFTLKFTSESSHYGSTEQDCAVCLTPYEKDQEVCRLPCNHMMCRNCTEQWFKTPDEGKEGRLKHQCVICRHICC